jgi:hypothetical protein
LLVAKDDRHNAASDILSKAAKSKGALLRPITFQDTPGSDAERQNSQRATQI